MLILYFKFFYIYILPLNPNPNNNIRNHLVILKVLVKVLLCYVLNEIRCT